MSDLFERFTGFRSFVNPLQDDLVNIYVALDALDNTLVSTPSEAIDFIDDLDIEDILRRYSSRSSGLTNYQHRLSSRINQLQFSKFKGLIGDVSYV